MDDREDAVTSARMSDAVEAGMAQQEKEQAESTRNCADAPDELLTDAQLSISETTQPTYVPGLVIGVGQSSPRGASRDKAAVRRQRRQRGIDSKSAPSL
jgi:hypothetical protein